MKGPLRHIFAAFPARPLSAATAAVVLVLSLAYGMVALVGYSVSFDKTTFRLLRGESNLFYMLAKWENNRIDVDIPENLNMQARRSPLSTTLTASCCGPSTTSRG
ncbi:Virulence sensor histidine kinase PhoQ [Raoultella terrigena]|uniref:Virulence sensor histidine kinase PhoQ n=1 Tax=Raoultella terrigena TaxID=577 RepID=A0A3P8M323_RAOTE|nr:Virulence sensor histidine kinase PhoQ [Raoultella terrigena]